MNNCFKEIEEKNKKFIEILKNIILDNRNSLNQEQITKDDYNFSNIEPRYECVNLEKKITAINENLNILKIKFQLRPTGHKNKMDYYVTLIPEEKEHIGDYTLHFHLNKKTMELKSISHNFNLGGRNIKKFTYTSKSTIYEIPKEKKSIKIQDKNTENNIEELSDIFLLTHDINFIEDLKFSLMIIGTDKDKDKFIKSYEGINRFSYIKKLINKIV